MNWTTIKVIISYILVLTLWIGSLVTLKVMWVSKENEHKDLQSKAGQLRQEIDTIGNATSSGLLSKLKFYEDYFQKKRSIYILEIWGMVEYILPANNFIDNVSFGTDAQSITFDFHQNDVTSLIKIYRNLNEMKNRGLITEYTLNEISVENTETLLDNKFKLYTLNISFSPNILEDNSIMIDFLKKMDKYYASIYNWPLKKVECLEYLNEEDWQTYCKDIDQINKDAQLEAEKLEQLRLEEEKLEKEKQKEIKKKQKEDNERAEKLQKEQEKKQKQEEEKLKKEQEKKQKDNNKKNKNKNKKDKNKKKKTS